MGSVKILMVVKVKELLELDKEILFLEKDAKLSSVLYLKKLKILTIEL